MTASATVLAAFLCGLWFLRRCEQPMTTTLDQLKPGKSGRIVQINGADGIAARLREMGFIQGAAVRAMRPAPFGDPLKCLVQGCRIALRIGEAQRIRIQLEA